jgi:hypothetical protein
MALNHGAETSNIPTDIGHIVQIRTLVAAGGSLAQKIAYRIVGTPQSSHIPIGERMVLTRLDKSLMVSTIRLMENKDIGSQMGGTHLDLNALHPHLARADIDEDTIGLHMGVMAGIEIEELLIKTMVSEQVFGTTRQMVFGLGDERLVAIQETTHFAEDGMGFVVQTYGKKIGEIGIA